MFEIIADRRHADVFRFVARIHDGGYDIAEFQRGLSDAIRTMMIVNLEGVDHAEVREDLRERVTELAGRFAAGDLLRMLSQVAELDTEGRLRKSANPRIMLEALLLRFAHMSNTLELEAILRGEPITPARSAPATPARPTPAPTPAPPRASASAGAKTPAPPPPAPRASAPEPAPAPVAP